MDKPKGHHQIALLFTHVTIYLISAVGEGW